MFSTFIVCIYDVYSWKTIFKLVVHQKHLRNRYTETSFSTRPVYLVSELTFWNVSFYYNVLVTAFSSRLLFLFQNVLCTIFTSLQGSVSFYSTIDVFVLHELILSGWPFMVCRRTVFRRYNILNPNLRAPNRVHVECPRWRNLRVDLFYIIFIEYCCTDQTINRSRIRKLSMDSGTSVIWFRNSRSEWYCVCEYFHTTPQLPVYDSRY